MLDPKTVREAIPIMGEAFGLDPIEDKPEILRYLNKFRNVIYTRYSDWHIFDNVFHTICVTDFGRYQGFTLPDDVVSIEAAWIYGRPLTLHSRWRESHTGLGISGCVRTIVTEMAETFPVERDIQTCSKLKIFTEREEDDCKCLNVDVLDETGKLKSLTFKLISDGWAIDHTKVSKVVSVVLPEGLSGSVTLAQEDGYVLSQYSPWESVPNYRRFKVADNCCKGAVLIQGVKRFRPVFLDHDIVEVGDALVIEAAGQYFKFGDNTSDTNQINVAESWLNKMRVLINGLIARHRGGSIQDGNVPIRSIRKKSLPGYK